MDGRSTKPATPEAKLCLAFLRRFLRYVLLRGMDGQPDGC